MGCIHYLIALDSEQKTPPLGTLEDLSKKETLIRVFIENHRYEPVKLVADCDDDRDFMFWDEDIESVKEAEKQEKICFKEEDILEVAGLMNETTEKIKQVTSSLVKQTALINELREKIEGDEKHDA